MHKLTIRDLFAVVTLVAVLVAWWVDRSRLSSKIDGLVTQNREFHEWKAVQAQLAKIVIPPLNDCQFDGPAYAHQHDQ